MTRGIPIRAISRALTVISIVSREGPISIKDVSIATDLPYPTACRIIQTLLHEGVIEREPARKLYRVTSLVQTFAAGFRLEDRLAQAARPHIEAVSRDLGWALAITTRVGIRMMVRDTTHSISQLTFAKQYPGFTMPITQCASGKAYIAFCSDDERRSIIEGLKATDNDEARIGLRYLQNAKLSQNILENRCAVETQSFGQSGPSKMASIAVPVFDKNDTIIGSLALLYFMTAYNQVTAIKEFRPTLEALASSIAADFGVLAATKPAH